MLYADSKETVRRQVFSRRFVRENITKNQALDVKRNLKLLELEKDFKNKKEHKVIRNMSGRDAVSEDATSLFLFKSS